MRNSVVIRNTFRFGVKGSGRRMFRGKALRIRLRIWMQEGGMTSQKLKWWSHKNSGKSCSNTSNTRNVPLYNSRTCQHLTRLRKFQETMKWTDVVNIYIQAMKEKCNSSNSCSQITMNKTLPQGSLIKRQTHVFSYRLDPCLLQQCTKGIALKRNHTPDHWHPHFEDRAP